ncbi:MAG: beta-ketoacyl-ACP synthase II [Paludibacteraceae bacterium]|nr:beta-ketoacyl-ACP synthase II [Paludibacteraceae bacterium]
MELKRVVVTGLGAITPLGHNVPDTWQAMIDGISGIDEIKGFDATLFKTHFAAEVKDWDIQSMLDRKEARKMDRYAQFAVWSAREALQDAALDLDKEDRERIGVIWGTGMGGLIAFEEDSMGYARGDGTPRFNPFYIPKSITNMGAGHISLVFGLKGPNYATTSACSSSGHAIAAAFDAIRLGRASVILTGGSDADVTYSGIGGFNSLRAISTRNDSPSSASRPFSASRDGFVLGEGGGCLILEEYQHAVDRGAKIYAEMAGAGLNADAYHMTAPDPEGKGAAAAMRLALQDACLTPADIDYINAHGTSTPLGDVAEVKAIQQVWGEDAYRLNISSTKSMTGHLLGATGAVEAIASVLAVKNDIVPPTISHAADDEDPAIDYRLNFTFNQAQKRKVRAAMSNTFGFGGHNACLIFRKFTD